jgi:two-component system chemotaxis response regulator CheB
MSTRIRVLIADDSAVVRRILKDALSADPDIDVAAFARNGEEAVKMTSEAKPDVVLLDVEMPIMNGLDAVSAIRRFDQLVPIVMFSTLTQKGGETTLEALARGATDFASKPSNYSSVLKVSAAIQQDLIPKIRLLGYRHQLRKLGPKSPLRITQKPAKPRPTATGAPRTIEVVAIGASTGGPNALAEVLPKIPAGFPVPILIVQHMPPLFTELLASRLNASCPLHVAQATDGALVRPGDVWIAPGDFHMTVARSGASRVLRLHKGPPENFCRPAVDVMFRSVAEAYGSSALAVVMTGMGKDGAAGAAAIRKAGGPIFAQDEPTSVVYGMPKAVVDAELADQVLPLSEIAAAITAAVKPRRLLSAVS